MDLVVADSCSVETVDRTATPAVTTSCLVQRTAVGCPAERRTAADAIAERRLAFNFSGINVVVKTRRSAIATTKIRDEKGEVVRDEAGEIVRVPVEQATSVSIRRGHMINLLHTVAYFEFWGRKGSIPVSAPDYLLTAMMDNQGERLPLLRGVASHQVWFKGSMLAGSGYHPNRKAAPYVRMRPLIDQMTKT